MCNSMERNFLTYLVLVLFALSMYVSLQSANSMLWQTADDIAVRTLPPQLGHVVNP